MVAEQFNLCQNQVDIHWTAYESSSRQIYAIHSFNTIIIIKVTILNILVNKSDVQALTLAGPTREDPVLDPLAVIHLDNQLYTKMKYLSLKKI